MARNLQYPPSVKPGIPRLGETPKGWSRVTFGDVLQVVEREAQLNDDDEYQLVVARRNRGGIAPREKLLGREILTKSQFLTHSGDFLISKRQIVHGACGIVPPELHGSVVSNEYAVLHARDGLNLKYLEYYTHSLHFQQTCFHASVGVAVEKMIFRLDEWLRHPMNLPPRRIQDYVVDVLGAWDRAIEGLKNAIVAKRRLRHAIANQLLFGIRRLNGFGRVPERFKDTEVGTIPDEWDVTFLGRCLSELPTYGINAPAVPFQETLPTYLRITDISDANRMSSEQRVSVDHVNSAEYLLRDGDVVFARTGATVGKSYLYRPADGPLVFAGFLIRIRTNPSQLIPSYLAAYASTRQYWNWVRKMSTRSGQPGLNGSEYQQLPLPQPTVEEQEAIVDVLGNADREIELLNQEQNLLVRQQAGVMEKLLSGRTKVTT
jgi:type I restriction enzyme S subunit